MWITKWIIHVKLDRAKEQIAYLKLWLGILVATVISLTGWLISNFQLVHPVLIFAAVFSLFILSYAGYKTNEAPPQTNESWVGSIIGKLWLSPHWLTLREDAHVIPVNRTHERTFMYVTLSRFNPPAPIPGTIRKWCNSRLFLGKLLFSWGKGYFCPSF